MKVKEIIGKVNNVFEIVRHYLPLDRSDWDIHWKRFADFNYLTEGNAGTRFKFYAQLTLFLLFLVFWGVFFLIKRKKIISSPPRSKYFKRLVIFFFIFAAVGFLMLLFRYENIKFLSSRILLLTSFAVFMFWGLYLLIAYFTRLPRKERDYQAWLLKQKYLPKKKRKP